MILVITGSSGSIQALRSQVGMGSKLQNFEGPDIMIFLTSALDTLSKFERNAAASISGISEGVVCEA